MNQNFVSAFSFPLFFIWKDVYSHFFNWKDVFHTFSIKRTFINTFSIGRTFIHTFSIERTFIHISPKRRNRRKGVYASFINWNDVFVNFHCTTFKHDILWALRIKVLKVFAISAALISLFLSDDFGLFKDLLWSFNLN